MLWSLVHRFFRFLKLVCISLLSVVVLWITYSTFWILSRPRFNPDLHLNSNIPSIWPDDNSWFYTQVPLDYLVDEDSHHSSSPPPPSLNVLVRPPLTTTTKPSPLVVLMHGFPESAWLCWQSVIPHLAPHFHIVAPDQRGYNRSFAPSSVSDYSVDILAQDIQSVIRHFRAKNHHQKVYVVAHDWGGGVAWRLVRMMEEEEDQNEDSTKQTQTQLITKFVIASAPHPAAMQEMLRTSLSQLRKSWYIFFFQIPWLPEWVLSLRDFNGAKNMIFEASCLGRKIFPRDLLTHYLDLWSGGGGSMTTSINWYRAALWYDHRSNNEDFVAKKTPVMLVWGDRDSALDLWMAKLSLLRIPKGRLEILADTTHWITHERPRALAEKINSFFWEEQAADEV